MSYENNDDNHGHGDSGHPNSSDKYNYVHRLNHDFVSHADHTLGQYVLAPNQAQYGGAELSGGNYVAKSPITGLRPVIEQAIKDITGSYASVDAAIAALGSSENLESAIAQRLTQLNDWDDLTTDTQNEIMIQSGVNFNAMSEDEREETINHLLHSPLPFGDIEALLTPSVTIDLGYTHTLDKTKTISEHLGDGIYKISMISNNNDGSHTGHVLGSFKVDMSEYPTDLSQGQWAMSVISDSEIGGRGDNDSYAIGRPDNEVWLPSNSNFGIQTITLSYETATYVTGVDIYGSTDYATGNVTKVELKDADGNWHVAWEGSATSSTSIPKLFIDFPTNPSFETQDVRVTINTDTYNSWEAVDAVRLISATGIYDNTDGTGRELQAIDIGNDMVNNTNDNTKLLLDQAAQDVLYGDTEEKEYKHPEDEHGDDEVHHFVEHATEHYRDALIDQQAEFGGYTVVSDTSIVGWSKITGLQPVVEQAIDQVKAAQPNISGEALERAVAQQITNLNDWDDLTEVTQSKLTILTGINFDGMSADEREETINHLLHSPLPFAIIDDVLSTDVQINLGYTHTLDETKTESEHLGDGIYEVRIISNNNDGSHTGHLLGSFKIDMSEEARSDVTTQFAISASSTSPYITSTSYPAATAKLINDGNATGAANNAPWYSANGNAGELTILTTYQNAVRVGAIDVYGTSSHPTGNVTKVELRDTNGDWHVVWTGAATSDLSNTKLHIAFDVTEFEAKAARITVDSDSHSGVEAVDAIAIVSAPADGDDGGAREAKAIEIGNGMLSYTNDNTKLYLDDAAKKVLSGEIERIDLGINTPFIAQFANYNHIHGDSGDNVLVGTSANDHIIAGGGEDLIIGSAGNDYIDGGADPYNQINYAGSVSEYTFTDNGNGTISVTKPSGTDTIININGVVFIGDDKWYSIEELLKGVYTNPHNATILGTEGRDYINGTDGDDIIDVRTGVDVVEASAGDDVVYAADGDYNQINYEGKAADYQFNLNEDGTLTVVKPNGTDTLHGITALTFKGSEEWYTPAQVAAKYPTTETPQPTIVGTDGVDSKEGTDGDDYFDLKDGNDAAFSSAGDDLIDGGAGGYDQVEYSGSSTDYTFTRNSDGSYKVVKPNGTDTLKNIEYIWFVGDKKWSAVDDLVEEGNEFGATEGNDVIRSTDGNDTIGALGGDDEIFGSTGNDTIDGGSGTNQIDYAGSSEDYTVTKNDNDTYTIVKPDGTDTVTNINSIYFFGDELWSTIDDLIDGGEEEGPGDGDDVIHGTDGDDNFNGLGGSDEFFGSAGDDTLNGGSGDEYDQIDYYGSSSDYTFTQSEDGSYKVVSEDDGTDLLINIEGVYFFGDEVLADIEDLI